LTAAARAAHPQSGRDGKTPPCRTEKHHSGSGSLILLNLTHTTARRSEAHGSSTLSTSRRVSRAVRRQSLLGEQQAPARSRLDPPRSRLSRLSGDRPQRGESRRKVAAWRPPVPINSGLASRSRSTAIGAWNAAATLLPGATASPPNRTKPPGARRSLWTCFGKVESFS
jgi:hypothetical protein